MVAMRGRREGRKMKFQYHFRTSTGMAFEPERVSCPRKFMRLLLHVNWNLFSTKSDGCYSEPGAPSCILTKSAPAEKLVITPVDNFHYAWLTLYRLKPLRIAGRTLWRTWAVQKSKKLKFSNAEIIIRDFFKTDHSAFDKDLNSTKFRKRRQ